MINDWDGYEVATLEFLFVDWSQRKGKATKKLVQYSSKCWI